MAQTSLLGPTHWLGMQAHYLRLDCTSSANDWLVSIDSVQRHALESISYTTPREEVQKELARQLLWQDFGHRGDWQEPAASASISSKAGWEVGILHTLLGDDVYILARKSPQREASCLPPNHFGMSLIHDQHRDLVPSLSGRVLLVKAGEVQSEAGTAFCFHSYTAEEFAVGVQNINKGILAKVSFKFHREAAVDHIPGTMPQCGSPLEGLEATYVRLTCATNGAGQWSVVAEPCRRKALVSIVSPCSFKEMRQQLAGDLLWHDFGHDSDWRHPSSNSHISAKYGWEVGLLETKFEDDICMLARKPPSGEERFIPYNHFATQLMHDKHRPMIRFVNGSVLVVKGTFSHRGTCTFGSLSLADFCAAYSKLSSDVRAGITLTTSSGDGYDTDCANELIRHAGFDALKPVEEGSVSYVSAAQADLDEWELVPVVDLFDGEFVPVVDLLVSSAQADLVDGGSCNEEDVGLLDPARIDVFPEMSASWTIPK